MALLNISGADMPSPVKYNVSLADIQSSNSGRSDAGFMTLEVVRSDVATIDVEWAHLTYEELKTITDAIAPASFPVKFFYGTTMTQNMYKSDRKIDLDKDLLHWNLSFSLVSL